jgi:hypothetical protein
MAVFESQFKELGFYVDGSFKKFKNGRFVTENKAEIAALDKLGDARKVIEPKVEAPAKPAEEKAKEPAPKPKRKAPAKSSDK